MAKFTPGPAVAAVSGSVGGTVFSHNRGGAYMRNRSIPVASTTSFALAAKAALAAGSIAWQALSAANKLCWAGWAASNPITDSLGQQQLLTGHQAYVGSYARAEAAGIPPLTQPPILPAPLPLASVTLTADIGAGNVEIAFTATPLGAADYFWLKVAVVSSSGINYVNNLLKFAGRSAAAQASPFDIEALLTARVGLPQVGQILHVDCSVFGASTTLLSAPIRTSAVVTTT